ncbi:solute carrier family 25 member 38 [Amanita rubescens]|nr:solute carrier family 25 member 38 [Amanita rubescens]
MSNVGQQLVSGSLSGLASTVFLQPFDLLKTRLQQGSTICTRSAKIHAIIQTTKTVFRTDGLRGLWRGTEASLARNVPGFAMYMTGLTQLRISMAKSPYFAGIQSSSATNTTLLPTLTTQGNLIAGATARVAVGFLLNPFSVLKARYESNMYAYKSFSQALVSVARQGPSEILRGFVASSLRDAPYSGLFLVFYEEIKRDTSSFIAPMSSQPSPTVHAFSAAVAGTIATTLTHPFDVIKTKMQVRRESRYHRISSTVGAIWQNRGIFGYFDGLSLRMYRKVLSSAIVWTVYESVLLFLRARSVQDEAR